jgi:hypothetical protein
MNRYVTKSILTATLMSALYSGAAAAEEVTLPTATMDKTSARYGETVDVSGTAKASEWVTLRVMDSTGSIVVFDGARSDASGAYRFSFTLPTTAARGTLTVQTGYGTSVVTKQLVVSSSSSSDSSTAAVPAAPAAPAIPSKAESRFEVKPNISKGEDGRTQATAAVTAAELMKAGEQGNGLVAIIVHAANADTVALQLPGQALQALGRMNADAKLQVVTPNGTYELPAGKLDWSALSASVGTSADQLTVEVKLTKATEGQASEVKSKANTLGGKTVAGIVDFAVYVSGNGKSAEVKDYGRTYVNRTLEVDAGVSTSAATGVYVAPNGELRFAPTQFVQIDGKWQAVIKRNSNSLYTVVESHRSFQDLQGHWSEKDVTQLASKLIIQGMSDMQFQPDTPISRAQFTAILVRALGLSEGGLADFKDVDTKAWYHGAVAAAYQAKLVSGFEDGSFRPNQQITRQELAVLIRNALQFVGKQENRTEAAAGLSSLKDSSAIAAWAQEAVALAVQTGIASGREDGSFQPNDQATRAEAVVMVKRFLTKAEFISP